jgi:hypothetical protein
VKVVEVDLEMGWLCEKMDVVAVEVDVEVGWVWRWRGRGRGI